MTSERLKLIWHEYLRQQGLKITRQREAIADAFLRSSGHVSPEQLLAEARKVSPRVGPATVYRTLRRLEASGLASSRQFGPGQALYEVTAERAHHDHIICVRCGHIIEFKSAEIERLQEREAHRHGFSLERHRHELYGLCEKARGIPGGRCPFEESQHGGQGGARRGRARSD